MSSETLGVRNEALSGRSQIRRRARWNAIAELALSASGVALTIFMTLHLALLFTVLVGSDTMDDLAEFLEKYFLLQIGIAPVIFLLAFHIVVASRRIPSTLAKQRLAARHMGGIKHFDTYTWGFQVISGMLLVALAFGHIWIVTNSLPIEAAKSGARVFERYIWVYIPFVLLVEGHISFGLYRVAVKWGILRRRTTHILLIFWTILVLSVGFGILYEFYDLGRAAAQ